MENKSVMGEYWEETNRYHKPINEMKMSTISKRDLRIGNMFEQGIVWKISGRAGAKVHLHGKGKWYKGFRSEVSVEQLKPILLTPEVLVKWCEAKEVGFDSGFTVRCNVGGLILNRRDSNGECVIDFYYKEVVIKYLHELQNVYYIVFRKELEIKG